LVLLEFFLGPRGVRELSIQWLTVLQTSPQELWPRGNRWKRIALLGKKAPEVRVMPAELLPWTVAMLANARTEPLDFRYECIAIEFCEVFVHSRF
jgi:hypothetical protein